MRKLVLAVIGAFGLIAVSTANGNAATFQDVTLGGVNLTAWCQHSFGRNFKARLIGNDAGDWACEQSPGNRRPISVKSACRLQYGVRAYKARALSWSNPYSWRCFARKRVPTMKGVDLTRWCKAVYGSAFKARLIAHNAGGWTCEQSAGNRRPISVKNACKVQYGSRSYAAKALNWSDPYSWKCLLR